MKHYLSDGKKLLNVEYDDIPTLSDTIDGMMVISKDERSVDEIAFFLLEQNGAVTCYVLDEIYIIGSVNGFHNLLEATQAWHNDEI
jgi:hypothetical protein